MQSKAKEQETTEEAPAVRIKSGWVTISYRAAVVLILATLPLWSDRHNDERYVPREIYQKDLAHAREMNDAHNAEVERQLRAQSDSLKEIKDDVKTIVQSMMKGQTRL